MTSLPGRPESRPLRPESGSPGTFRLGSVFGFDIRIHWSWLFAFVLVTWSLQGGFLPAVYPDWPAERRWAAGAITSLLFFGSVLAHELAHSVVARRRGHQVHDITLFVFGGVSALGHEPRSARDEFWIAIVGPLMSFATAVAFGAAWFGARAAGIEQIHPIAGYLALINVSLGLFNLLPGFPLDGGRVFRSLVWARKRDLLGATRIASMVGRGTAALLIGLGLVSTLTGGASVNGFWFVLIGWYLWGAAGTAYRQLLLESSLGDVPLEALIDRDVPRVPPDMTLGELARTRVLGGNHDAFFVAATDDGDVFGLVTVADLRRVPGAQWDTTTVYRAMTPRERLITAEPSTAALAALHVMVERDLDAVPVFRGRDALGLVTRATLLRAIQLRGALVGRSQSAAL